MTVRGLPAIWAPKENASAAAPRSGAGPMVIRAAPWGSQHSHSQPIARSPSASSASLPSTHRAHRASGVRRVLYIIVTWLSSKASACLPTSKSLSKISLSAGKLKAGCKHCAGALHGDSGDHSKHGALFPLRRGAHLCRCQAEIASRARAAARAVCP